MCQKLGLDARLATVVAIVLLGAPPVAQAHLRSGVVATDYRATADRVPPAVTSVISVRVYRTDRALALTVARGNVVSVLGASGAPLLHVDDRLGARSTTVIWHDPRLRGLPAGTEHGRWTVPLTVDGAPTQIHGEMWRQRAPPLWPWLLVGLPLIVLAAVALRAPRRRQAAMCVGFAGLAVFATVAIAVGFAASRSASPARELEGFDELVTAAVGVFFLLRGAPEPRLIAAVALGFLAFFAGCLKLSVLTHGIVLSAAPAAAARGSVALALWSGIAAIITGGRLLATNLRSSIAIGAPTVPR
jgi:hypothetical protein